MLIVTSCFKSLLPAPVPKDSGTEEQVLHVGTALDLLFVFDIGGIKRN